MTGSCNKPGCGLKDGLNCDKGELDPRSCPHFQSGAVPPTEPNASDVAADSMAIRLPWTGRALGVNDMVLATARSQTELVALVGPFNAGKTALLTALFSHLAKTGEIAGHEFAGSYSLEGWARLREFTKWPSASGHSFPPHTPDSGERVPSLLHIAFRRKGSLIHDLLFTDAPGEWYTHWLRNQSADNAKGARWIAANATKFVFVVDREGLASSEQGLVRNNTLMLARILSEQRRGRPITAVWTKSDMKSNEEVERPIRQRLRELFGKHPSLNLSVHDESSLELLKGLLESRPAEIQARKPTLTESAFMSYGSSLP
jgi:Double-GTPase 2